MENTKTIVCPNCGATSSNLDKCEFCENFLVKIASVLLPSTEDMKSEMKKLGFGNTEYVSTTIQNELDKCISISEKLNIKANLLLANRDRGLVMEFSYSPTTSSMLKLLFHKKDRLMYSKFHLFEEHKISSLFEIHQDADTIYGSVVLDKDTRTITQLIQFILDGIYDCNDAIVNTRLRTTINNHNYSFEKTNDRVFENNGSVLKICVGYECYEYIKLITLQKSSSNRFDFRKIIDQDLYGILYADPIMRRKVDYDYKLDHDTSLELSSRGVLWGLKESKEKYIAMVKEKGLCCRSYYLKNIKDDLFGFISEDYDPKVYGSIEEYVVKEENKIHQAATSEVEDNIQRMNEQLVVTESSNSGCMPILIPIIIIFGLIGSIIF